MKALSSATGVVRHTLGAAAEAILLAAIIAALLLALSPIYAPAGFLSGTQGVDAGRGGNGNSIVVASAATARVAASYGGSVTTLSTLGKDYFLVYVRVVCTQDGQWVYEDWENIKTGTWSTDGYATFKLAGSSWSGGSASCDADLLNAVMKGGHRVYKELATTSFFVSG